MFKRPVNIIKASLSTWKNSLKLCKQLEAHWNILYSTTHSFALSISILNTNYMSEIVWNINYETYCMAEVVETINLANEKMHFHWSLCNGQWNINLRVQLFYFYFYIIMFYCNILSSILWEESRAPGCRRYIVRVIGFAVDRPVIWYYFLCYFDELQSEFRKTLKFKAIIQLFGEVFWEAIFMAPLL